jgi:hypothetical protein
MLGIKLLPYDKITFIYVHLCLFICTLERACWQDELRQDPKNDSKTPTKRESIFNKTFEKMEGFSFATPVTGPNRLNTGKEDDDDICTLTTHFQ